MSMLDIRKILITYPWTATDYIEFTQNYQNQTTFTDINKSKTLKDQIAAAAFYQMISNLIYFMREEMLSLL